MPFQANFQSFDKSSFKKKEFIDLPLGKHVIRLLHEDALVVFTHFIASQSLMVRCLGDDCPICSRNKVLYAEAKAKAKAGGGKVETNNIPGYFSRTQTAYLNVLDRTLVKICPSTECQAEVKPANIAGKFPVACPKCGASISSVSALPLDKVKIFSFGKENKEQIAAAEASTLDSEGTPIGIMNFDLDIMVMMSGSRKSKVITAGSGRDKTPEVPEDMLYDLEEACQTFTVDELNSIVSGTKIRDIYATRKATAPKKEEEVDDDEIDTSILDNVDGLFLK